MDWSALLGPLEKFAVPAVKAAITAGVSAVPMIGPFAAPFVANAVGDMIAKAFDVPGATPDVVAAAVAATPSDIAAAKLAAIEAEATAKWPALAIIAQAEETTAQVQAVQTTEQMKTEVLAATTVSEESGWRNVVLVMNAIWRPLFALEWLIECMCFTMLFISTLIRSDQFDIDSILKLQYIILAYMGARFGLVGWHMNLRTREKETAINAVTDTPPPVSMDDIKAMLRKGGVKLK